MPKYPVKSTWDFNNPATYIFSIFLFVHFGTNLFTYNLSRERRFPSSHGIEPES